MREIPLKNYVIFFLICLGTGLLLLLFVNRVEKMNIGKKSPLTGFLYEISNENIIDNLENYAMDNYEFYLYISNHNGNSDFDLNFKEYITNNNMKDQIIYLNGWNKLSHDFAQRFKNRLFSTNLNSVSFASLQQSNLYKFQNGKVIAVLYEDKSNINLNDIQKFIESFGDMNA